MKGREPQLLTMVVAHVDRPVCASTQSLLTWSQIPDVFREGERESERERAQGEWLRGDQPQRGKDLELRFDDAVDKLREKPKPEVNDATRPPSQRAAIAEKGAFSICVPGSFGPADGEELSGAQLIGESLATLSGEADFDKWHVFFAGERLDGEESFLLAKKLWIDSCGIPESQVHPVPQGMPAEGAAAQYTAEICMQDETILVDSDQGLPAVDLLLLDMAKDGTIGRLKPNSPEVEEAGSGKVILPVEDDDAEAAIAAPDFMNAARTAVIVATGAAAAASVNKALDSASSACPASLIRTDKTIWLLDAESAQDVSEP
ncbi:unnamed protein product [Symbiodinium necroappetens]|uniref:Glucosamine/galactosamine-6-phosphate isomerase domain-containing protein n=1 Tax=Symbiodinium necroappetens TaxID=1628268 RepID=A0A812JZS6_9DINO|nr:unnamed protein product [Symbiodinium necroappetens]